MFVTGKNGNKGQPEEGMMTAQSLRVATNRCLITENATGLRQVLVLPLLVELVDEPVLVVAIPSPPRRRACHGLVPSPTW